MSDIKISVIIPVYNGEKYIKRCLFSLERQTFKYFELIIINDGSQDKTEKIIDDFIGRSSLNVRYIYQKNAGQAAARNRGLKKAAGDYIAFIDGDDYVARDYLERLYCAALDNESEMVVCGYQQIDENGKVLRHVRLTREKAEPYGPAGMFVVWSKLFSRKFLLKNDFRFQEGGKIFEDVPYSIVTKFTSHNPIAIDYCGYYYVVRKGSTMNSGTIKSNRFPYEKMTEAIRICLRKNGGEERERLEYEVLHFFAGFIFLYCRKANWMDIDLIVSYSTRIIRTYFPRYYKNKFVGIAKNKKQTFLERLAVTVFVMMNKVKLIKPFAKVITRI